MTWVTFDFYLSINCYNERCWPSISFDNLITWFFVEIPTERCFPCYGTSDQSSCDYSHTTPCAKICVESISYVASFSYICFWECDEGHSHFNGRDAVASIFYRLSWVYLLLFLCYHIQNKSWASFYFSIHFLYTRHGSCSVLWWFRGVDDISWVYLFLG